MSLVFLSWVIFTFSPLVQTFYSLHRQTIMSFVAINQILYVSSIYYLHSKILFLAQVIYKSLITNVLQTTPNKNAPCSVHSPLRAPTRGSKQAMHSYQPVVKPPNKMAHSYWTTFGHVSRLPERDIKTLALHFCGLTKMQVKQTTYIKWELWILSKGCGFLISSFL